MFIHTHPVASAAKILKFPSLLLSPAVSGNFQLGSGMCVWEGGGGGEVVTGSVDCVGILCKYPVTVFLFFPPAFRADWSSARN